MSQKKEIRLELRRRGFQVRPALLFIKEWEMQLQMFCAELRINAHGKEQMLVYFLLADHVDY